MARIQELKKMEDVDQVLQANRVKPVFIFKHSHICPISIHAFDEYQRFVSGYDKDDFDFTLIIIRNYRELSNAVAERTGVKHESPQAILVNKGKALWDDSHFELTSEKLKQVVMMYENGDIGD